MFLFDIVANKRNSIDVDKFDYIQRDCYNLNHPSSYDCSRLMNFNRVINNRICFEEKEVYTVYELFHTRYSLFKQIYTHRAGSVDFFF
jgi:HD superfamily phosphohydrolase